MTDAGADPEGGEAAPAASRSDGSAPAASCPGGSAPAASRPGGSGPAASRPGPAPSLQATGLAKRFGAQLALRGVDLTVDAGEVVALLGENGSGKSTLVKILAGYHEPEPGGELRMAGRQVPLPVPLGGFRDVGLAFVFQDLGLANELTVVENLFVGRRLSGSRSARHPINWRVERRAAREVFARYRVELDPTAVVGRLRPTAQALLAIVRAAEDLRAYRESSGAAGGAGAGGAGAGGVLVLDEPTVFLPEHEKVFLFDLVRRVVSDGTGVLFVSHDMTAVRQIATRAVVLRDGTKVGDVAVAATSDVELVRLVSGHRLADRSLPPPGQSPAGGDAPSEGPGASSAPPAVPAVLQIRGLTGGRLRGVDLDVHEGEIVGVAGLLGSGSEDLPYALFGALPGASGTVRLPASAWEGDIAGLDPGRARELGIALVPADRKQQGTAAELPVDLNMLALVLPRYRRRGLLAHGRLRRDARERCETFDVRPRDPTKNVSALSGGNQQKVVLAKWLELGPRLLFLHEPTQGVDVATRVEIYAIMRERCRHGVGVLWVSTDFDELATVADRILVCAGGVIAGSLSPPFTRDRITSEVYSTAARRGESKVEITA